MAESPPSSSNISPLRLYRGRVVNPNYDEQGVDILEDHLIAVDPQGIITHSEPASSPASKALLSRSTTTTLIAVDTPDNAFLLPGFIDTHLHAPQYLYTGTALDEPLMVWLEKYTFQAESRIDKDPEGLGRKVYTTLAKRLIENGTTMASLYGTLTVDANMVLARTFHDAGLRALVGKVNMDQNGPQYYVETTEESLKATTDFVQRMRAMYAADTKPSSKLVEPCITPRFIPTCSKALLLGLADIARRDAVDVQSHLSESADEVAFTKSLWQGREDTDIFDSLGLLTSRSLFAHCTHLSLPHLDLLTRRGASISCCPLSNVYFSERAFPLKEAMELDTKVGLGSDISGGYSISLQNSMRWAVGISRHRDGRRKDAIPDSTTAEVGTQNLEITWRQSIYLATLGGARALNRDSYLGSFEVGKSFDAQLVVVGDEGAGSEVDLFQETYEGGRVPPELLVEKWWCNGTPADRKGVWVAGRRLR